MAVKRTTMRPVQQPAVGDIVDTVYGRQQVMDVLDLPYDEPTMFFRPERGGREWCVALGQLDRVLVDWTG